MRTVVEGSGLARRAYGRDAGICVYDLRLRAGGFFPAEPGNGLANLGSGARVSQHVPLLAGEEQGARHDVT